MERDIGQKITGNNRPAYVRLKNRLLEYGSLAVGYSGGTDSTLLLYVAASLLPGRVKAFTADTLYMFRDEMKLAETFCRTYDIPHEILTLPFQEKIRNNPEDRCYLCKLNIFSQMKKAASGQGYTNLADGSHADDLHDYRPGRKALKELGIRSPLQEADLTKSDIRALAKDLGLPNWNLPANACLLTRLPHNQKIHENILPRLEEGEKVIRNMDFNQVRLRFSGTMAAIEVAPEEIDRFRDENLRTKIFRQLQEIGFPRVSIDMEGYRTGKMNPENIKYKEL